MTKLYKCDACGETATGDPVAVYAYSTNSEGKRIVRTADMHLVCFASVKIVSKQGKELRIEWTEKAVERKVRS